jgi:hypothetical protein
LGKKKKLEEFTERRRREDARKLHTAPERGEERGLETNFVLPYGSILGANFLKYLPVKLFYIHPGGVNIQLLVILRKTSFIRIVLLCCGIEVSRRRGEDFCGDERTQDISHKNKYFIVLYEKPSIIQ